MCTGNVKDFVQVFYVYNLQHAQILDCTSCNLYKLQISSVAQRILMTSYFEINKINIIILLKCLFNVSYTSSTLHRLFVRVATCTKSQFEHNIYIPIIQIAWQKIQDTASNGVSDIPKFDLDLNKILDTMF